MRKLPRLAAVSGALVAFMMIAAPANADAQNYLNGVTINAADLEADAIQNAGFATDPDVTCSTPVAEGSNYTVAADAHPVGTLDGNDIAIGQGECVSLQRVPFQVTIHVEIQYLPLGATAYVLINAQCQVNNTVSAINGVAPVVGGPVTCFYTAASAAAGRPHRAHAVLSNTLSANKYKGDSLLPWTGGVPKISG